MDCSTKVQTSVPQRIRSMRNAFQQDLISELMGKQRRRQERYKLKENAVPSKFAFVGDKRKRGSSKARAGKSLRKDIIDNLLTEKEETHGSITNVNVSVEDKATTSSANVQSFSEFSTTTIIPTDAESLPFILDNVSPKPISSENTTTETSESSACESQQDSSFYVPNDDDSEYYDDCDSGSNFDANKIYMIEFNELSKLFSFCF